ncbi:hypothetical protein GCM10017667_25660 [Streptomyces filamentosus]|uniref:Uncharacterized protein n=1 Tax=Streptomyces filamentosus TaxID=67294 RepID=A0A919BIN5_STRFL|nr:hypothetical protein GCM10017667_25660 [Streptomyces filamentosus]
MLALPCLVLAGSGTARAGGVGDKALRMTVTVNTLGHSGKRPPAVRAGAEVVKRYRLENRGEADLYAVRVRDPGVPAGSVRCSGRWLAGLGVMECVARFRALPGDHRATARAEGDVPSLGRTLAATARSGYTGVAGVLTLAEKVTPGKGPGAAAVTYTVGNRGNRVLHGVRVTDPALGLTGRGVDCGGGGTARGGVVPALAPGASARCTASVRRPPGVHRSTGVATGTDRVGTYAPGGRRLPAPLLTARARASFTVPEPPRAGGTEPPGGAESSGGTEPPEGTRPPGGVRPPGGGTPPGGVPGRPGAPGAAVPPAAVGVLPVGPPGPDPAPEAGAEAPGAGAGADGAGDGAGTGAGAGAGTGVGAVGDEGVGEGAVEAAPGEGRAPDAAVPPRTPPARTSPSRDTGGTTGEAVGETAAEAARRAAAADGEGFLGRLRRRSREAEEMEVVVLLLLVLVPAALAAALLGNRRT